VSNSAINQRVITLGLSGVLLMLLVFLKLIGSINSSWFLVLLPAYWWIVVVVLYGIYRSVVHKFFTKKNECGSWIAFDNSNANTFPKKAGKYLIMRGQEIPKTEDWTGLCWKNSNGITHWLKLKT